MTLDNLKDETILLVIDASVTAERDILQGVEEDIVKANYVRMIMSGRKNNSITLSKSL